MIALRDRPDPPGPSCILKKTLVASTIASRSVYLRMARPTISSDVPFVYAFAVSQNVMPSSTACRKIGSADWSSSAQPLDPREASPKLMQPSAIRLILSPDAPRRVYCIGLFPLLSTIDPPILSPFPAHRLLAPGAAAWRSEFRRCRQPSRPRARAHAG